MMTCLWCDSPTTNNNNLCNDCNTIYFGPTCKHGFIDISLCYGCYRDNIDRETLEQLKAIRTKFLNEAPYERWFGMEFGKLHFQTMIDGAINDLEKKNA